MKQKEIFMKELSIKKIVLTCICVVVCVAMLAGLSSSIIKVKTGVDEVDKLVEANGYDLLSFDYPTTVRAMLDSGLFRKNFVDGYAKAFGALSVIALVVSVIGIFVAIILCLFAPSKASKTAMTVIISLLFCISLVYMILSIMFTSSLTRTLERYSSDESLAAVEYIKLATTMYVPFILETLFFGAYIVCLCGIKEKPLAIAHNEGKIVNNNRTSQTRTIEDTSEELSDVLKADLSTITLIEKYNGFCNDGIISSSDFIDKKVNLLTCSDRKLSETIPTLLQNASFEDIMEAENTIAELLVGYSDLHKKGILTDSEFVAKKGMLLSLLKE